MGLFKLDKKIYVSSSVYNMAGDENDRPNFLKSSMFSAIMNPYDAYLGETIVSNYLKGPGILQRSFFNYAVRRDLAGLPTFSFRNTTDIDPDVVAPFIPVAMSPVGLQTNIQSAELTDGDFTIWAEKYLLENDPAVNTTDWVCDYDKTNHEITIQYVSGGSATFDASNYDKDKQFIIARYYQSVPARVEALVTGSSTVDDLTPPTTVGYSLDSETNTGVENFSLDQNVEVTKVYSDGVTPTTVETTPQTILEDYNPTERLYSRTDYQGGNGVNGETSNIERFYYLTERREITTDLVGTDVVVVNDLGGGETETVTTNTSGEFLTAIYNWREDTQETILEAIEGDPSIYIYEIGTGESVLDALQTETTLAGDPEYYPFLPIRLDNLTIRNGIYTDLFSETKSAYRRATRGQSFDKIIDEVEDNPDLGDIDYCYMQWGVSVNVIETACRKYMYEFFRDMITYQNSSATTVADFKSKVSTYNSAFSALEGWIEDQTDPGNAHYGDPRPDVPSLSMPPSTTVRLRSDHPSLGGFDNRYSWVTIEEELLNGVGKPGAVEGDYWFETGETYNWDVHSGFDSDLYAAKDTTTNTMNQMWLFKQTGTFTYSRLSIWGMVHHNYIYGGKSVRTTLKEGVDDLEPSVFIIPLHAPTVRVMGVKDFTQMATANTWLTFNSYLVVKQKWYETFLGMLLIMIVVFTVAALIAPAAVGGATGILGTNAAVGASFGLSGISATVAGAVTNAIAATVIARAVSTVSIEIFGEKWGAIIAAVVTFAISAGTSGGFNFSNMMSPQNLLQLGSAIANGYQGFVAANIGEINAQKLENEYGYEFAKDGLEQMMRDKGLINDLSFDQLTLTDSIKGNDSRVSSTYVPESLDEFINRTTMTGSDIVELTLSMVTNYAELQQTLPKK